MPAPIIYINGHPGVGKLTTAQHIQPLLPGSQILHNHDLIDPVEKHCPRHSARYQSERQQYRQQRLRPIRKDPELQATIFILTDSQTEYSDCVSDYTDLCLSSATGGPGRRFYSVILECEALENERRLVLLGRGGGREWEVDRCGRVEGV